MKRKFFKCIQFLLLTVLLLFFIRQPAMAVSDFTVEATANKDHTVTLSVTVNNHQAPIEGFDFYCAEEGQSQYRYIGSSTLKYPNLYVEPTTTPAPTTEAPTTEPTTEQTTPPYNDDDNWNNDWIYETPSDNTTEPTVPMEPATEAPTEPATTDWYDDYYYYYGPETITFKDTTKHSPYKKCYYHIDAYQMQNGVKVITQSKEISVMIQKEATKITYGKRNGKLNAKIKWNKVNDADGYLIYCLKSSGKRYDYKYSENCYKESKYKLVKTIKNKNTTSATFKHLKHGISYSYRVYSYKNLYGEQRKSLTSSPKEVIMDYYTYASESDKSKTKRAFGSEKAKKKNFKTAARASKQMKTIRIKVWDFKNGRSGQKVTKTKYLTVNKNLAPSIKKMFDEVHKSKEKQVIRDIGCYSYRQGEHMYGMAIDINPNENYMIDGKTPKVGSCWKPKTNPYSIPLKCEMVDIMERYGFYRGLWGYRKDYMHFSYFNT